jgi:hypothetical protein
VLEDLRAVSFQMVHILQAALASAAQQLLEPPLTFQERKSAKILSVQL